MTEPGVPRPQESNPKSDNPVQNDPGANALPKDVAEARATLPPADLLAVESLVTEDDTPVDSFFVDSQRRLLTTPLYSTWGGLAPGRSFIAASDVGIFRTPGEPPLVPDVFLSLDVNLLIDSRFAEGRSYCMWYYRKPPDVAIEIVSSDKGDEIHVMFDNYARFGVRCLVIFNPTRRAQEGMLRAYELAPSATYVESAPDPLPDTGLGLKLWDGEFEKMNATWLRWHVASGPPILTGEERASRAKERTERAMERTRQANEQVARLAPLLRKHGISLDNNDDQS